MDLFPQKLIPQELGLRGLFKMKVAELIVETLISLGVTRFYGMSGGAAVHLFDAVYSDARADLVCVANEQSAAIAADGYFRATGKVAACIVTSGPGATNLLTGACCSFYDSIPVLILTGQVARNRMRKSSNVRQVGFQETQTCEIFKSVTKSSSLLLDSRSVVETIRDSFHLAISGRMGPVHLDIPDDLQRELVTAILPPTVPKAWDFESHSSEASSLEPVIQALGFSKSPIVVLGLGARISSDSYALNQQLSHLNIPVLSTWGALGLVDQSFQLDLGSFGVYGNRFGNEKISVCDFLLVIGSRLSQNLTGSNLKQFAPNAVKCVVDIDENELAKFEGMGLSINFKIRDDAATFMKHLCSNFERSISENWSNWNAQIIGEKKNRRLFESGLPASVRGMKGHVDATVVVQFLKQILDPSDFLFVDTGGNLTWTCNGLSVGCPSLVNSAWNFTPMGYAVPAALGSAGLSNNSKTVVIIGDGGLQLCAGELATLAKYFQNNLVIFVFNNRGHGIQKQTLETWLGGKYVGVDSDSGLAFSDFGLIAKASSFKNYEISVDSEIENVIDLAWQESTDNICLVECLISPEQRLHPFCKSGSSLDRQLPDK